MMRVRFHSNAEELAAFLVAFDYPAPWHVRTLKDYCLMLRVEDYHSPRDIGLAGYVWATWTNETDQVLDFHVCISPAYQGRWLTRKVWDDLYKIAVLCGAKAIETTTIGDRTARLVAAMLIRRFGFKRAPDGAIYKTIEENNGQAEAEEAASPETSADTAAAVRTDAG